MYLMYCKRICHMGQRWSGVQYSLVETSGTFSPSFAETSWGRCSVHVYGMVMEWQKITLRQRLRIRNNLFDALKCCLIAIHVLHSWDEFTVCPWHSDHPVKPVLSDCHSYQGFSTVTISPGLRKTSEKKSRIHLDIFQKWPWNRFRNNIPPKTT